MDNAASRLLYFQERARYPLYRRFTESQFRSGRVWREENLCFTGVRTPHRPARCWPLCRPRYPNLCIYPCSWFIWYSYDGHSLWIKRATVMNLTKAKVRRIHNLHLNFALRFNQERLINETWFFNFRLLLHICMVYVHLIISGISPVLCYNHGYAYIIRRSLFAK